MKKQTLVVMEQSRKSSERERIALQQAKEALALKEAAVTEAAHATSREDYMLELMTDASLVWRVCFASLRFLSTLFACFYLSL
jgi:hypothetical protein